METASEIRQALYRGDRGAAALLAAAADVDIFEAASLGDGDAVRALLAGDSSLVAAWSDDGFTALQLAAFLGNAEAVRALIEAGADVNAVARHEMGIQPLHAAAAAPAGIDIETCRLLIEAGADVNGKQASGHTPLDEAELRTHDELIALLREHGAA